MTTQALHAKLRKIVRRGRVLTAPAQLAGYDADGLGYKTFRPDAVVIPADAPELAELMSQARADAPLWMWCAAALLAAGPIAGVVLDRLDRRTLLLAGVWLRAGILGLFALLPKEPLFLLPLGFCHCIVNGSSGRPCLLASLNLELHHLGHQLPILLLMGEFKLHRASLMLHLCKLQGVSVPLRFHHQLRVPSLGRLELRLQLIYHPRSV